MTGSTEIGSRTPFPPIGDANLRERGRWTRLSERFAQFSVIGILALAGQQSFAGYRAVHAEQASVLNRPPLAVSPSAPTDLVFAPDGSLSGAMVITVSDASGVNSTITVDAAGKISVN